MHAGLCNRLSSSFGAWNVAGVEHHGRSLGANHKVMIDTRLQAPPLTPTMTAAVGEGLGEGACLAYGAMEEVGRTMVRGAALHMGLQMHQLETALLDEPLLPPGTQTHRGEDRGAKRIGWNSTQWHLVG
jgi:hypothetical protein